MDFYLIALAILPGIVILVYVYFRDVHEKEPRRLLARAFFGGMAITVLAIGLELIMDYLTGGISHYIWAVIIDAFLVIALVEEGCKFLILTGNIYKEEEFNEPFDGIIYSVMISMGFATFENIFYVWEGGLRVAMLRMMSAVPAHASFAVLMGAFVGLAKFKSHSRLWQLAGLFVAVVFHGAYDFFLIQQSHPQLMPLAFAVLSFGIVISFILMRTLSDLSPFKSKFFPELVDSHSDGSKQNDPE